MKFLNQIFSRKPFLFSVIFTSAVILSFLSSACSTVATIDNTTKRRVITLTVKNFVNVFFVQDGTKWLMIDAGLAEEQEWMDDQIKQLGINPRDIELMIITHGHFDHAGAASYFQKKYGIPIVAGKPDSVLFATGRIEHICPTGVFARFIKSTFPDKPFPTFVPDKWITGDTTLPLSNGNLKIYMLGGHTPGSLVVQIEKQLFVSDLIRGEPLDNHHPAIHFFMCDLEQNKTNIRRMLQLDAEQWFTGHFGNLKTADVQKFYDTEIGTTSK